MALSMQERRRQPEPPGTTEQFFGLALREVRLERGLTQENLAFESGYHPTYISMLERGKKSPSLRAIVSLAAVLDMNPSELLQRFETKLPRSGRRGAMSTRKR